MAAAVIALLAVAAILQSCASPAPGVRPPLGTVPARPEVKEEEPAPPAQRATAATKIVVVAKPDPAAADLTRHERTPVPNFAAKPETAAKPTTPVAAVGPAVADDDGTATPGQGAVALEPAKPAPALSWAADPPADDRYWPRRWDRTFRKYSRRFFGAAFDWRWFKAQGIAESGLQADSLSHAGAQGLMQIMPATWGDIARRLSVTDPWDPRHSIAAGIYYDRWLFEQWRIDDLLQRMAMTLASYNAGAARVMRARDRCSASCDTWPAVAPHAPGETRAYVCRIGHLIGLELCVADRLSAASGC